MQQDTFDNTTDCPRPVPHAGVGPAGMKLVEALANGVCGLLTARM